MKLLIHCTFEWGVKSVEQKASYAKSKQATEPQTQTYTITIGGYTHSESHAILLHSYGDFVYSKLPRLIFPRYLVYSIKRLPTPKVNKLQSPKLRLTQSLLVATFTQNFMRFRCTVMEKRHQNFPLHSSVCDDRLPCLYICMGQTLRPFYSSLENATTLKQAPFRSF